MMRNHFQMKKIFFGRCSWEEHWVFLKMEKSGPVRDALHSLKYRHCPQVGRALGKLWALQIERQYGRPNWDVIITVPLTNEKKMKRGYNQCDCIAEPMGERWNVPLVQDILIKRKGSKSQTLKSRIMRNSSAENPFEVVDSERWEGKHILLLDDVVTTGATLEQCYLALRRIKNVRLSMAALAIPVHNRLII
jgi:ComF family protein